MPELIDCAVRDYHELLRDGLAEEVHAVLSRQFVDRKLLFNGKPVCSVLRPNFITAETYENIQNAAEVVIKALATMCDKSISEKEIAQELDIGELDREMMLLDGNDGLPSIVGRLDGLLSSDGSFKFIEYNTIPAGIFLMDGLAEAFRATSAMVSFTDRYSYSSVPTGDELVSAITDVYGESLRKDRLVIVCVGAMPAGNSSEFELFREAVTLRGHVFHAVALDAEWVLRNRHAFVDGLQVDVALMFSQVSRDFFVKNGKDHPLLCAVRFGTARLFNGMYRTAFLGSKHSFSTISDPTFTRHFDRSVAMDLTKVIPWTRLVRQAETSYKGEKVDLISFILNHKDKLVLKPAHSYGGNGVFLGWQCDAKSWSEAVARHPEQALVIQERVPIYETEYPMFVNGKLEIRRVYSDFNVYVWRERYAKGCMVRISPHELLNVSAGYGSDVPTFIIGCR